MFCLLYKKTGADIKYIASANGVSGTKLARKYKIKQSTTDYLKIIKDNNVDTIIVTTRHDTHAKFVIESLQEGKNVFVEKPLAISEKQLDKIIATYQILDNPNVMVGFNRRFSPHLKGVKKALNNGSGPINIVVTVNAGFIPNTHWTQDIEQGGGRIIGEACHMMDVCVFLSGSQIERVCMNGLGKSPLSNIDNASLLLKLKNGSNAVINYFSNGSKSYSKERIEVYSQERTIIIDDFKTTKAYGVSGFRPIKTKTDKGQNSQFNDFIDLVINGGLPLIPFDDLINVSRASFAAVESMKKRKWIELPCI